MKALLVRPGTDPQDKLTVLRRYLAAPQGCQVMLDARCPSVSLPAALMDRPRVLLALPADGLPRQAVSWWGLRVRLNFRSGEFRCLVPWDAVYLLDPQQHQHAVLWTDSMPPELRAPQAADPAPRSVAHGG